MSQRLNQKLFESKLALNPDFAPKIGQVADEATAVETGQIQKFSQEGTGIKLRKYRVRICGEHPASTPITDLPVAYGQSPTSGLRGESCGQPFYPANTFVTVFKEPTTGLYYIDDVHPNSVGELDEKQDELNKDFILPSKCKKVNTEAINKKINDLLESVNKIRNSFLTLIMDANNPYLISTTPSCSCISISKLSRQNIISPGGIIRYLTYPPEKLSS